MTDVSRETQGKLNALAALIRRWNPRINLVAPSTIDHIWDRHILDSLYMVEALAKPPAWCDLGSGAGFPGLIAAIRHPGIPVTLIESDRRKAVFLRDAAARLAPNATILDSRIEDAPAQRAPLVSARALAPLARLIPLALRHGTPDTRYLFPKGRRHAEEIAEAERGYRFDIDLRPSRTDKEAVILILENVARV